MSMFKKRRVLVVAIAAMAILLAGTGVAVAAGTFKSATSVTRTTVLTENAVRTFASASFQTLTSSSVFAGASSVVLVTFSAESSCYNGNGWCSLRILIDGVEADPVAGTDFAFDSTDGNRETVSSWESHSVQRTRVVTTTGTHSIVVQVAEVGTGVIAWYDDWTLTSFAIAP